MLLVLTVTPTLNWHNNSTTEVSSISSGAVTSKPFTYSTKLYSSPGLPSSTVKVQVSILACVIPA